MPRFHAGFSGGTVVGALLGVLLIELGVPALVHLVGIVAAGHRAGVAHVPVVPARGGAPRGERHLGGARLARAADAADRRHGAGPGDDRGHGQRLAGRRAGRRSRRLPRRGRRRLRRLRARDDRGPLRRDRPHRPVRPRGGAVGHDGARRRRRPADRPRRAAGARRGRHRAVGSGRLARFPGRHERRRRRPGPRPRRGSAWFDHRLRRVPRRPAAPRLRRRRGRAR